MAHALGTTRSHMLIHAMRDEAPSAFEALIQRRLAYEPVAHIVGRQEFYGLDLEVSPNTLIPRSDSETLIEAAREAFGSRRAPRRILDLGTGTGALLLAALDLWKTARGFGLDASEGAVNVTRRNAARLGFGDRATMDVGDWTQTGWRDGLGGFDLVLCNPPYIEAAASLDPDVADYEPHSALFAGPDGLDDYRLLAPHIRALIEPGGIAVFEIGHTQADAVTEIFAAEGFAITLRQDLAGRARALVLS
ncbi:peptide chain release factor N(5)-glutamine methyltransferase [Erythrobacter litoralis]|nr:peptide chain release factor N(5)-glutamine methyltransferase [Erythrobacter litoralis]